LFAAPLSRECNADETKSHGDFNPWRAIRVGGGLENRWGRLGAVLPNKARIPGTVSSITVADHRRRTIEKLIDHAVSRKRLDSRAFSIDINRFDWGTEVFT